MGLGVTGGEHTHTHLPTLTPRPVRGDAGASFKAVAKGARDILTRGTNQFNQFKNLNFKRLFKTAATDWYSSQSGWLLSQSA